MPAKLYPMPQKPISAIFACQDPIFLPAWMAEADLTTEAGLAEWGRQNWRTISNNGLAWEKCRLKKAVLIEWINNLPESE